MKPTLLSSRRATLGLALLVIAADYTLSCALGTDRFLSGPGGDDGLLLASVFGLCDTLEGPVIKLARKALETGNVNHVLPWVRQQDEHEIRQAFDHTLAVRKLGPRARELADRHFFETLVRVHRASEGAPYTGLKSPETDLGPAAPEAHKALETGFNKALVNLLTDAVRSGLHRHYQATMCSKAFPADDVAAGRRYVEAYESYFHYVERLWHAATGAAHGHHSEHAEEKPQHGHPAQVH